MQESENKQHDKFSTLCRSILRNINAALSVGGPERDDGHAGRLRDTYIHKATGISRSTLRLIRKINQDEKLSPDLSTLHRLSELLGIPLPFLIMTPDDWNIIIKAIGDLNYMGEAANKSIKGDQISHSSVKKILMEGKMLITSKPCEESPNPKEIEHLDRINDNRRRVSHIIGSLMLMHSPSRIRSQNQELALVTLAASITNQINERKQ